jgi:lipoprotein-releasing system permease protein
VSWSWFLIWRYLTTRPIHLLVAGGVMLAVWALIVVVSIFSGYIVELERHTRSTTSDLTVVRLAPAARFATLEPALLADPDVAAVAPRVVAYGLVHGRDGQRRPERLLLDGPGSESRFLMLIGIDPARESRTTGLSRWLANAAPERRVADPARPFAGVAQPILLSERRLGLEGLVPGQRADLTFARRGRTPDSVLDIESAAVTVAGAYVAGHAAFDQMNAFLPIDFLRELLGAPDEVTEIVVRLRDGADPEAAKGRLQQALVERHPRMAGDSVVLTAAQHNPLFRSAVDHQRSLMKIVLFVIMVVAAFLMYATLSMMVHEKTHDVGILTAMGATRRAVVRVFAGCGLGIVALGTLAGIGIGCISAIELDSFNRWLRATFGIDLFPTDVYQLTRVPYDLDPVWIGQVAAVAMVVGLIASIRSAAAVGKMDPLAALRNE